MKKILGIILCFLMMKSAYAADSTLSQLDNLTSADNADSFYVHDSDSGDTNSKYISWNQMEASIDEVGTIATGVWQGTDVGAAHGGTGASTLTDGGVLLGSGTGAITPMAVLADSEMIVGDGTTDPVAESGDTLRTSVGVGFDGSADPNVQMTTTHDVAIGTSHNDSAKLGVDGDSDQIQFHIQEHSTQTNFNMIVEESDGTTRIFRIDTNGKIDTAVGLDAIGAVDISIGSADVTDVDFTTDGTGDAEIVLPADSVGPSEIDSTTGAYDFGGVTSLEIPNSATPTVNAAGEVALDTTITNHDGLLVYYQGSETMVVPAIPLADLTTTDGHVIDYNSSGTKFTMAAPASGGETNSLEVVTTGIASTEIPIGTAADTAAYASLSGDATMTNAGVVTVVDDSHNHVITNIDSFTKAQLETQTSDVSDYAEADGDVYTGTHDFGGADHTELPNSATYSPGTTTGRLGLDTTITSYDGLWRYYDGAVEMVIVAMPAADLTTTDNDVVAYASGKSGFNMEAQAGGGGASEISLDMRPHQVKFPDTNMMATDSSEEYWSLTSDADTEDTAYFQTMIDDDYGGGTLYADVVYTMNSATSGSIVMCMAVDAQSPNVDTDDFGDTPTWGARNSTTDVVPGTAGAPGMLTITLTDDDSLDAGDLVMFALIHDSDDSSDTATGNTEIRHVQIRE